MGTSKDNLGGALAIFRRGVTTMTYEKPIIQKLGLAEDLIEGSGRTTKDDACGYRKHYGCCNS